jgi:hypothetical protein
MSLETIIMIQIHMYNFTHDLYRKLSMGPMICSHKRAVAHGPRGLHVSAQVMDMPDLHASGRRAGQCMTSLYYYLYYSIKMITRASTPMTPRPRPTLILPVPQCVPCPRPWRPLPFTTLSSAQAHSPTPLPLGVSPAVGAPAVQPPPTAVTQAPHPVAEEEQEGHHRQPQGALVVEDRL